MYFLKASGSGNSKPKKGEDASAVGPPPLERVRKSDMMFSVNHYADTVTYDAAGWCEKNKDALHLDMSKVT